MTTSLTFRHHFWVLLASLFVPLYAMPASAAAGHSPYPVMAPVGQYLVANRAQAISLARSAAPASISSHATVMVLTPHGYVTAVNGHNGFVCLVMRSWDNRVKSREFWNPKVRTPQCLNAAAHSVLSRYLRRTQWVLAGTSKNQIRQREQIMWAEGKMKEPKPGALCYMMSKRQYINDQGKAWRPHIMFYFPRARRPHWGANLPGSPVFDSTGAIGDTTVFIVLVPIWSDGTPAPHFR